MASSALIIGIIIVIIVVLAGAGLYEHGYNPASTTTINPSSTTSVYYSYSTTQASTTTSASTSQTTTISQSKAGIVVFNVTEKEYSITPNTFVINLNQTAYFNVTNDGMYDHDLGIYNYGPTFGTPVLNGGGGRGVFEFNSTTPGNYMLYSNVGNDRNMGMVGTLTIR